jgi:hypothetical protein
MTKDIGAFVPGPRIHIEGRPGGPLTGLTFAAKDLFDAAGVPTGGGIISPLLVIFWHRIYAASCSFWAGVMPLMPMFGRSWL